MKKNITLTIASFLLLSIVVFNPTSRSEEITNNILYVGGSGQGNYSSIQSAIDHAENGYTIFVSAGFYNESIKINKSINLIGHSSIDTFIIGYYEVVLLSANWINFSGFAIINKEPDLSFTTNPNIGIEIIEADYCTIKNNNISHAQLGVVLLFSDYNIILNNTINKIFDVGLSLFLSENNTIYCNNFINNSQNAVDHGNNSWDNGKYGNYWDDYSGLDKNNDAVGDTPYVIPELNNTDRYPLMMPYDGTIRLKEFYVDYAQLFTMLIIGMILVVIFLGIIGYIWYRKNR